MGKCFILSKKTNYFKKKLKRKDLSIKKLKIKQGEDFYEKENLLCDLSSRLEEMNGVKEYLTGKCKDNELQMEVLKIDLSKKNSENNFFQLTISQLKKQLNDQANHTDYLNSENIFLKKRVMQLELEKNFNEPDDMKNQNLKTKMNNKIKELGTENAAINLKFEAYKLYSEEILKKEKNISSTLARLNIDSGFKF